MVKKTECKCKKIEICNAYVEVSRKLDMCISGGYGHAISTETLKVVERILQEYMGRR